MSKHGKANTAAKDNKKKSKKAQPPNPASPRSEHTKSGQSSHRSPSKGQSAPAKQDSSHHHHSTAQAEQLHHRPQLQAWLDAEQDPYHTILEVVTEPAYTYDEGPWGITG